MSWQKCWTIKSIDFVQFVERKQFDHTDIVQTISNLGP